MPAHGSYEQDRDIITSVPDLASSGEVGAGFVVDDGELFDMAVTWRMVPTGSQRTPNDIGELAYKDLHHDVVCQVLNQLGQNTVDPRVCVIATLAAHIMFDIWNHRQLGPRTSYSMNAIVELLASDVIRASEQLSDVAMHALARHIQSTL